MTEKQNRFIHYLWVNMREIIKHLLTQYGKIKPKELKYIKEKMDAPINISQPISVFFTKMDYSIQIENDRKLPFTTR